MVLLMRVIYEVHRLDDLRWYDVHTKFHEDCFGHLSNINIIMASIWEAAMSRTNGKNLGSTPWDGFMWRVCIYMHQDSWRLVQAFKQYHKAFTP
jgi:hypothetical protein